VDYPLLHGFGISMKNTTTPFETALRMQRASFGYGQQLVTESIDTQQDVAEAFVQSVVATQQTVKEQGSAILQDVADGYFETVEDARDVFRSAIDGQADWNVRVFREFLVAQFDRNGDLGRAVVNAQFDAVRGLGRRS
jgi:hypothetical protein